MGEAVEEGDYLHARYSLRTRLTEDVRRKPILNLPSRERSHQLGTGRKCFLVALLATGIAGGVSAQNISFPGTRSEAKSPNGRFVIKNSDSDLADPAHTLTLIDRGNASEIKIYQYGRGVDVLWSRSSEAFVINDHEGSNVAHPILFREPWSTKYTDLREELVDFLRSRNEAKSVLENHHVYITAQKWLSHNEVLCKVTGYGDVDPNGFTKYYVYKLGVGFGLYR